MRDSKGPGLQHVTYEFGVVHVPPGEVFSIGRYLRRGVVSCRGSSPAEQGESTPAAALPIHRPTGVPGKNATGQSPRTKSHWEKALLGQNATNE